MRSRGNDGFAYKGIGDWRRLVSLRSRLSRQVPYVTTKSFQLQLMMNMNFICRLSIAVGALFLANDVVAVPRWSASTEQVCGLVSRPQDTAKGCTSAGATTSVIAAGNCSHPEDVVIKFLQRPLEADKIGVLQSQTQGTAAHVQIVVEDKATGKVYENFGLTGSFTKTEKAKIFSEQSLDKYDRENPLGIVEMSFDDYARSRDRTKSQARDSYYAPLNNVDPISYAAVGATVGFALGGGPGMLYGGKAGTGMAFNEYDNNSRRNYKIVEEDKSKMSFAGFNCQSLVDLFLANARNEPSFEEILQYRQPGEIRPAQDPESENCDTSGLKRAEGCNACKCKHETANLKPQIWRNGLDEECSIVVLCAECMAVKYSVDLKDKKKAERKICSCASPDVFFAGVCRKKIGVLDKLWAQHYCRKCGGFRRGDLMDLIKTDKGIAVYPAGVVPSDWDGKVYEESELDEHVKSIVK